MRARVRRARSRGAALFVVMLVITLLATIAAFAASAASMATAASGSTRHSSQAHYITELALLTATSELSTTRLDAYVGALTDPASTVTCTQEDTTSGTKNCYVFGRTDLETVSGKTLFPTGSLGPTGVDTDFRVEMTDLGPAVVPVPGADLTGSGATNIEYKQVTLTAYARTFLVVPNNSSGISQSLHATRAHLIVGPLPKTY